MLDRKLILCIDKSHLDAEWSEAARSAARIYIWQFSKTPLICFYERLDLIIFAYLRVPLKWLHYVASPEKTQWFSSSEFLGSHTTSNGLEWIVGLHCEGKVNREVQPWPSPGLRGEGPGLPKVDTCPRDALDRPKTDPQYARNSFGKGLGTLEHVSLERLKVFTLGHTKVDSISNQIDFLTKNLNFLV